jgi:hypothetical protein
MKAHKVLTAFLSSPLFEGCNDGVFGENCDSSCGRCLDSQPCHNINGACLNGCESGYIGSNCTEGKRCIYTLHVNRLIEMTPIYLRYNGYECFQLYVPFILYTCELNCISGSTKFEKWEALQKCLPTPK